MLEACFPKASSMLQLFLPRLLLAAIVLSALPLCAQDYSQSQKSFLPAILPRQVDVPIVNVGLSKVPRFGFRSTFGDIGFAQGEIVHEVARGSIAQQMKLLPGDVILAVNGTRLENANSWYEATQRAVRRDGWVTLKVKSARTGAVEYRTTNLLRAKSRP